MATKVKIGKRKYKSRKANLPKNIYGTTSGHEITIRSGLRGRLEAKTKLHEILHGCVNEYAKEEHEIHVEEDIVYAIEKGVSEFAKHNPEEWIMLAVILMR